MADAHGPMLDKDVPRSGVCPSKPYRRQLRELAQVGVAQVGVARVGVAQVGIAQVGVAQDGVVQVGVAQVGLAKTTFSLLYC